MASVKRSALRASLALAKTAGLSPTATTRSISGTARRPHRVPSVATAAASRTTRLVKGTLRALASCNPREYQRCGAIAARVEAAWIHLGKARPPCATIMAAECAPSPTISQGGQSRRKSHRKSHPPTFSMHVSRPHVPHASARPSPPPPLLYHQSGLTQGECSLWSCGGPRVGSDGLRRCARVAGQARRSSYRSLTTRHLAPPSTTLRIHRDALHSERMLRLPLSLLCRRTCRRTPLLAYVSRGLHCKVADAQAELSVLHDGCEGVAPRQAALEAVRSLPGRYRHSFADTLPSLPQLPACIYIIKITQSWASFDHVF